MNTKTIAWITGSLTLLMALFSFVLSFNALTNLASQHGVSIPPLFPLVVEAGVVIFSLNGLYRSVNGESARWQWALIIGSSLLAGSPRPSRRPQPSDGRHAQLVFAAVI